MHSTMFRKIPVVIQWPKGSTRVGEREDGTPFKTEMTADYGYIPDTVAAGDSERLDIYIGPNEDAENAYVVEQMKEDGETFDEYKVLLGFDSLDEAEETYLEHVEEQQLGDISEVPFEYLFDTVMEERGEDEEQEREEIGAELEQDEQKVAAVEPDKVDTDPGVEFKRMFEYLNSLGWLGRNPWYPEKWPFFAMRLYSDGWKWSRWDKPEAEGNNLADLKKFLAQFDLGKLKTPKTPTTINAQPVPRKLNAGHDEEQHGEKLSVIDAFVKLYKHEVDFYEEVAAMVAEELDGAIQDAGIRAIITHRAKKPNRLRGKLVKRDQNRHYQSFRDIKDDIVDLAGVRVALYLPKDRDAVGGIIEKLFAPVRAPKRFPENRSEGDGVGYVATHYLVQLRPENLHKKELRYADTNVEIQVASVLMHAWSEVTHDLTYKPIAGPLTEDELRMVNDLNDVVQSGEAILNELQEAVEGRTSKELRFDITAALTALAGKTAAGKVTWTETIGVASRLAALDQSGALNGYMKALGWEQMGPSQWYSPTHPQDVVHVFHDGWIHAQWGRNIGSGDGEQDLKAWLGQVGLGEAQHPHKQRPVTLGEGGVHTSYLRARLALWKAHKADELDDRLRAYNETLPKLPVGDERYMERALDALHPGKSMTELWALPKDEYHKVIALAQDLKKQANT
jgi:ppGpp synthetase/RelA/SpoT-type nucleotidyltranferase